MKNAAMHLDWMISMGIFLMFLVSILIFFKPGAEPAYQKDFLLPIIENNFKDAVYYSIERIPITGDVDISTIEYDISYLEFEFPDNFPACGNINKFRIVDADTFNDVGFRISGSVGCTDDPRTAKILIQPITLKKDAVNHIRFYLLYSDDYIVHSQSSIDCRLTTVDGKPPNCVAMPDFKVGVSEIIRGLNAKILNSDYNLDGTLDGGYLQYITNNYGEELKKKWNYPVAKDFKICKDSLLDSDCYPNNAVVKIPDDANVFVREFKENLLNENTVLGGSVVINMRAW